MLSLVFQVFLLSGLVLSAQYNEKTWELWKKDYYKKALTSPSSFLNAYELKQGVKGETLYLHVSQDRKTTTWTKTKPEKFEASAQHLGTSIRVQILGQTRFYLSKQQGKRRQKWTLENGAVAEVVYGKRAGKMWTYLYDPDQVKNFTGFEFYPYNHKAILQGVFKAQKPRFVSYKTVQGDSTRVSQVGNVSFAMNGKDYFLPAYTWLNPGEPLKYIALVFTDESANKETYGGGRELIIENIEGIVNGMQVTLDFNRTVNFLCAHSPFFHCPVGLQKHLKMNLQAGEKLPKKKIVEMKK